MRVITSFFFLFFYFSQLSFHIVVQSKIIILLFTPSFHLAYLFTFCFCLFETLSLASPYFHSNITTAYLYPIIPLLFLTNLNIHGLCMILLLSLSAGFLLLASLSRKVSKLMNFPLLLPQFFLQSKQFLLEIYMPDL